MQRSGNRKIINTNVKMLVDVQQYNVGEFGDYVEVFRRIYGDCAGVLCV